MIEPLTATLLSTPSGLAPALGRVRIARQPAGHWPGGAIVRRVRAMAFGRFDGRTASRTGVID